MVTSFRHGFSVKPSAKGAFFVVRLNERGMHMSSALVFARGLKSREKF